MRGMVNRHLQRRRRGQINQRLRKNKHHQQHHHHSSKYRYYGLLLFIRSIKCGSKQGLVTQKKIHLPPQPIEGGISLWDQIPKIHDTPPDLIPPNDQAAEEIKYPNPSEEKESIGKEETPGDQIQKEFFDETLDPIPPAGQAA